MSQSSSAFAWRLPLLALFMAGQCLAMELPLPPPGGDVIGQAQVIKAKYEDTFASIGERYEFGYLEMVAANPGVDPWLPGEGKDIILPSRFILPPGPREGLVINLAEYRMYYFPAGKNVVHTFPLGIGREGWSSPIANTSIIAKTPNPTWTPPQSIREEHAAEGDPLPAVVPAGPDNPLGPFKFSLGLTGYLIHGSNKKFGIGMRVSHGCFRMLNKNVLELSQLASVGTKVRIIDEPYKFGKSDGKLYLEVHAPLENADPLSLMDKHTQIVAALNRYVEANPDVQRMDWNVVRDVVAAEDGLPISVADLDPTQKAVAASDPTAPQVENSDPNAATAGM